MSTCQSGMRKVHCSCLGHMQYDIKGSRSDVMMDGWMDGQMRLCLHMIVNPVREHKIELDQHANG